MKLPKKRTNDITKECLNKSSKKDNNNLCSKRKPKDKSHAWTCKYCKEIYKTQRELKVHRASHKPPPQDQDAEEPSFIFDEIQDLYICSVCSAEFQEKMEVEDHITVHQERHNCSECEESFKNLFDLGIHSTQHDPEQKIHCPLCSYVCSNPNPYSFKSHLNYVHLKKFPFYCKICAQAFKHYKPFEEHQNTHTGTKPYECVVCQKKFTYRKYLQVHQVRNHQVGTTGSRIENECRKCNRYFYKPEALQEHTCYKKKKGKSVCFLCETCGQTFTEKAKLLEHLRVHKGDLPFVCTWCGKKFPVKSYLKTHERVHTGEKPYSCEFCGKRFGHHAPFRVHRRTHTGERPYVCNFCNKGFTTNQGLKFHKRNCPPNLFKVEDGFTPSIPPTVIVQGHPGEEIFGI
ncbi:zinc finger protein 791-like [Sitophilus oryzae]|uniref:Zinc finger protein 791-like n=1 Tax=Sitophilus oryzae TaxID=7048 RepID=A0A6J2XNY3_SITOR|nr:zinc finger protein 791-like [Sitophilus oryzae]